MGGRRHGLTGTDEAQWLGWLGIAGEQLAQRQRLEQFAAEVKAGRRALRIHLGADVGAGLAKLATALRRALE